jgi:hypothetical protein
MPVDYTIDEKKDSDFVIELKMRGAAIEAERAAVFPTPTEPSVRDRYFSLKPHSAEGPGQAMQPDGTLTPGSYEAAGVAVPEEIEFAAKTYLQPGFAARFFECVKALETQAPDPTELAAGYLAGATSLLDAENRRTQHVAEALQALDALGGSYAAKLKASADKLPRSALQLLISVVDLNRRVIQERPK